MANKLNLVLLIAVFGISASFIPVDRTRTKASAALAYCKSNDLNTEFCILVDMSLHSGKKRFFVYQFTNDSIISSGLCAHGCGNGQWGMDGSKDNPTFSNMPESHCTSLGKYKIGKRGYSSWGINVNYKLHGLDATNSNAHDRLIVLHSWLMVPDEELFPAGTPEGWGCPAISNNQMTFMDLLLGKSEKPVLMWIYN